MTSLEKLYSDEIRFNSAIGLLLNYSLVEDREDVTEFVVHSVVHR